MLSEEIEQMTREIDQLSNGRDGNCILVKCIGEYSVMLCLFIFVLIICRGLLCANCFTFSSTLRKFLKVMIIPHILVTHFADYVQ